MLANEWRRKRTNIHVLDSANTLPETERAFYRWFHSAYRWMTPDAYQATHSPSMWRGFCWDSSSPYHWCTQLSAMTSWTQTTWSHGWECPSSLLPIVKHTNCRWMNLWILKNSRHCEALQWFIWYDRGLLNRTLSITWLTSGVFFDQLALLRICSLVHWWLFQLHLFLATFKWWYLRSKWSSIVDSLACGALWRWAVALCYKMKRRQETRRWISREEINTTHTRTKNVQLYCRSFIAFTSLSPDGRHHSH